MGLKDWFSRSKNYDCLLLDEVTDGMPVTEGDFKKLTLDGDSFVDKHRGLLYVRDRNVRPVRVRIEKEIKDIYLIANRCGVSMGTVMLNQGKKVMEYQIMGQAIPLTVDNLVLKIWTDPAMAYNINDNNGLKSMTKQNLLGMEVLLLLVIGIILGWFIIGPFVNFAVSLAIHWISGMMGGGTAAVK